MQRVNIEVRDLARKLAKIAYFLSAYSCAMMLTNNKTNTLFDHPKAIKPSKHDEYTQQGKRFMRWMLCAENNAMVVRFHEQLHAITQADSNCLDKFKKIIMGKLVAHENGSLSVAGGLMSCEVYYLFKFVEEAMDGNKNPYHQNVLQFILDEYETLTALSDRWNRFVVIKTNYTPNMFVNEAINLMREMLNAFTRSSTNLFLQKYKINHYKKISNLDVLNNQTDLLATETQKTRDSILALELLNKAEKDLHDTAAVNDVLNFIDENVINYAFKNRQYPGVAKFCDELTQLIHDTKLIIEIYFSIYGVTNNVASPRPGRNVDA